MARYKTRRAKRFENLRIVGFLGFEAITLSKITKAVPYFHILVKERYKRKQEAIKDGWTKTRYEDSIKREYRDNGWIVKSVRGYILPATVWNMFRTYEDAYRQKYPQYTSPWEKRRLSFRDSVKSVEASVKKNYAMWISDLDRSIANTTDPQKREQLGKQKKNLETWL